MAAARPGPPVTTKEHTMSTSYDPSSAGDGTDGRGRHGGPGRARHPPRPRHRRPPHGRGPGEGRVRRHQGRLGVLRLADGDGHRGAAHRPAGRRRRGRRAQHRDLGHRGHEPGDAGPQDRGPRRRHRAPADPVRLLLLRWLRRGADGALQRDEAGHRRVAVGRGHRGRRGRARRGRRLQVRRPRQAQQLPRIPVNEGTLSTGGIIALLVVAVASLVGAVLGGLAGMRFHRKVDQAGLGR